MHRLYVMRLQEQTGRRYQLWDQMMLVGVNADVEAHLAPLKMDLMSSPLDELMLDVEVDVHAMGAGDLPTVFAQ